MKNMDIEQISEQWSCNAHSMVNHRYDGLAYGVHLAMVVGFAKKYIDLIPNVRFRPKVLAACWAHDTIEDCRKTYNDVKQALGEDIAEIVFALTNEKGKTRKDRANEKYYQGIRAAKYASFVKICDRLANVQYSVNTGSSMIDAYKKEHDHFKAMLYEPKYDAMFFELNVLLNSVRNDEPSVATDDAQSGAADNQKKQ